MMALESTQFEAIYRAPRKQLLAGWVKMILLTPLIVALALSLWVAFVVFVIPKGTWQSIGGFLSAVVFVIAMVASFRIVANEICRYFALGDEGLRYKRFWPERHLSYQDVRMVRHEVGKEKLDRVFVSVRGGRQIGIYLTKPDCLECYRAISEFCDAAVSIDANQRIHRARNPDAQYEAAAVMKKTYRNRALRYGSLAIATFCWWTMTMVGYFTTTPTGYRPVSLLIVLPLFGLGMVIATFNSLRMARSASSNANNSA